VILTERALADTDELFAGAVAHIARRLGRVKPIDPATLPQGRSQVIAALDAWAGSEAETWRNELARFYEDHIPVHLRPDPALNAALRRLQAGGVRLACWSPGPEQAAGIVVHHLGLGRRIDRIGIGGSAGTAVSLADALAAARDRALVVGEDAEALSQVAAAGVGAALAAWAGASATDTALPVLATPADLVERVLGPTAVAG
jgi:phosphoglycolate phosphatase-like HAD superfamily hydrolase